MAMVPPPMPRTGSKSTVPSRASTKKISGSANLVSSLKKNQNVRPKKTTRQSRPPLPPTAPTPPPPSPPKAHVIRVTVLGLAGITVDRNKCDKRGGDSANILPAPPSKMRAIVAISRNSNLRGTSTLSKPLAPSPSDNNKVLEDDEHNADDCFSQSTKGEDSDHSSHQAGSGSRSFQRQVAVWTTDQSILGSVVTFETNLQSNDRSSNTLVPKSFELTIALAEDEDDQDGRGGGGESKSKVALPFGVATLAVSGKECSHGKAVRVDLPVLSLSQARPLFNNSNNTRQNSNNGNGGLGDYPMIAITAKPKNSNDAAGAASVVFDQPEKQRKGFQRLFQRNQQQQVQQVKGILPSTEERNAFAAAYSVDSSGDAIIRVGLEVYEKGSELEKLFLSRPRDAFSVQTPISNVGSQDQGSIASRTTANVPPPQLSISYDDRPDLFSDGTISFDDTDYSSSFYTEQTSFTEETDDQETSDEDDEESWDEDDDDDDDDDFADNSTLDSSFVSTQDGSVTFFAWSGSGSRSRNRNRGTSKRSKNNRKKKKSKNGNESDEETDYTLSFEKKPVDSSLCEGAIEAAHQGFEMRVFGKRIRFPMCASLPIRVPKEDDDYDIDTITTKDHDLKSKRSLPKLLANLPDDMVITAATKATKGVLGNTLCTGPTTGPSPAREQLQQLPTSQNNKNNNKEAAQEISLEISRTFSTLSEHSKQQVGSRATTVRDYLAQVSEASSSERRQAFDDPEPARRKTKEMYSSPIGDEDDGVGESGDNTTEKGSPGRSDDSPQGIMDFPDGTARNRTPFSDPSENSASVKGPGYGRGEEAQVPIKRKSPAPASKPGFMQTLTNIFQCQPQVIDPSLNGDVVNSRRPLRYEPFREEVPPVIIPSDGLSSVGDLTLTSEIPASIMLQKYRKQYHEQETKDRKPYATSRTFSNSTSIMTPFPVGMHHNTSITSSQQNSVNSGYRRGRAENYFAEYDEYSNLSRPITTKQHLSSGVTQSSISIRTPEGQEEQEIRIVDFTSPKPESRYRRPNR